MTAVKKQWTSSIADQWGLFLPPTRPSLSELCVIEKHLIALKQKRKNFRVAILGSTPEYRDLCQTYGIDYACIDYSSKNFRALKAYLCHKDEDFRCIEADWRTMRLEKKFDCFLGDLATTVTPVVDHDRLFSRIRVHCTPGALIFFKTPLRRTNRTQSHAEIFRHYRKHLSHLDPFAAVWHEVCLSDYDFTEDTMSCTASLESLAASYRKKIIPRGEFEEFQKRWEVLGDFKMNIPLKTAFLKKILEHFTVAKITSGTDWYRRQCPILILRAY